MARGEMTGPPLEVAGSSSLGVAPSNSENVRGSPLWLVKLLACDLAETGTSSAAMDCVERREGAAEDSTVPATDATRRACSLPSRIGQPRPREPMTSTCFRSEP